MNWLTYGVLAAFFYALFDIFLKLASTKMHSTLAGAVGNTVAAVFILFVLAYAWYNGEKVFEYKQDGMVYAILAGVAIGFVTIFFIRMFALGAPITVGVPLVRVGTVIFASIIAILFFKEVLTIRYAIGFLLSLAGLYLLLTAK